MPQTSPASPLSKRSPQNLAPHQNGKFWLLFALVACLIPCSTLRGDNWRRWRGPTHNGVAAGDEFPLKWDENTNVIWKTKIPGWGTSTPAIWSDQLFVSTNDEGKNVVFCFDRHGKQQWKVEAGGSASNRNRKASASNPSPTTDGKHVYGYFKSGDFICVDLSGKVIWQTNLQKQFGEDRLNWDLGTSPVLAGDNVVVAVMHQGPSYVVAFNKETGKQAWKTDRDLGAPAEARDSYSTPVVVEENGQEALVIVGADHVTAYAAADGKELWRVGGLNPEKQRNFRSIASAVVSGDYVVTPYSRGRTLLGIRRGGSGDVTKSHVLWTEYGTFSDVPSPVAQNGLIYLCTDRGEALCVDAKTGKEVWKIALPRNRYPYSSSPILAGGRLYTTREDGTTFVIQLGEKPELVATNALRENTYATPAFVDGRIYMRTSDFLFCIGKK